MMTFTVQRAHCNIIVSSVCSADTFSPTTQILTAVMMYVAAVPQILTLHTSMLSKNTEGGPPKHRDKVINHTRVSVLLILFACCAVCYFAIWIKFVCLSDCLLSVCSGIHCRGVWCTG